MYRTDFWTLWEKARVGWSERTASKHIYYQVWNGSPVQVGCMRQVLRAGALWRPRGMGWGERCEGVSGWGTNVNPWLIHVNVWQKPLQYCKVISLQLIEIIGKRKKKRKQNSSVRVREGYWFVCKPCFLYFWPNFAFSSIFTSTFRYTQSNQFLRLCGFSNVNFSPRHSQCGIKKKKDLNLIMSVSTLSSFQFLDLSFSLYSFMGLCLWKNWLTVTLELNLCAQHSIHIYPQFFICVTTYCYKLFLCN